MNHYQICWFICPISVIAIFLLVFTIIELEKRGAIKAQILVLIFLLVWVLNFLASFKVIMNL